MQDAKITLVLAKAILRMLRPLARILLRFEVSHGEFAELSKRSYVDAVYRYFSIPNRKKTYSRAAVLTGLNRKDVVRLASLGEDEVVQNKGTINRATRVVGGWLSDADFLDNHQPKVLPLKGPGASFESLVARYSGDISARAILDELVRVGVVTKPDKHTVNLNHHGYIPENSEQEKIAILSTHVADLLSTAAHNLTCEKKDTRFQRQVTYEDLPESVIADFQQYSYEKNLELLLDFNQWLAAKKESVKPAPGELTGRVGVGIYFFRNDK